MKTPTTRLLEDLASDLRGDVSPIERWEGEIGALRLKKKVLDLVRSREVRAPGSLDGDANEFLGLAAEPLSEELPAPSSPSPCLLSRHGVRYRFSQTGNGRYWLLVNCEREDLYGSRFVARIGERRMPGAWTIKNEQRPEEAAAGWSQVCAAFGDVTISGAVEDVLSELSIEEPE